MDLTEVYTKIRQIALADTGASGLVSLLGATNAFYFGEDMAGVPVFPCVVLRQLDDAPNMSDSFWGDFRPRVQIDVVGPDPGVLLQMVARLDHLFIIPFKRNDYISTARWNVRSMMRRSAIPLPFAEREQDGRVFQQIVTEWDLKITAKS